IRDYKVTGVQTCALPILPDGSGYPDPGRLNFSSSSVDPSLGTVQMRAVLPNPRLQLLPGQYVRVQVVAGTQQALVVPQSAVMQKIGRASCRERGEMAGGV